MNIIHYFLICELDLYTSHVIYLNFLLKLPLVLYSRSTYTQVYTVVYITNIIFEFLWIDSKTICCTCRMKKKIKEHSMLLSNSFVHSSNKIKSRNMYTRWEWHRRLQFKLILKWQKGDIRKSCLYSSFWRHDADKIFLRKECMKD